MNRMDTQYILSVSAIIVSIGGTIIGIVNRKRCRSRCCGRNLEASVAIDTMPPTPPEIKIPQDK